MVHLILIGVNSNELSQPTTPGLLSGGKRCKLLIVSGAVFFFARITRYPLKQQILVLLTQIDGAI